MTTRLATVLRYLLAALSLIGAVICVHGLWVNAHALGSDGLGTSNCAEENHPAVPSGAGLVATAHTLYCTYFIAHGGGTTYVYVHKVAEPDSARSLVFRFDDSEGDPPTEIVWSGPSTLLISIPAVGEVTREVHSIGSVKLVYRIGRQETPMGTSLKENRKSELEMIGMFVFFIAIFVLASRSIMKRRRARYEE